MYFGPVGGSWFLILIQTPWEYDSPPACYEENQKWHTTTETRWLPDCR